MPNPGFCQKKEESNEDVNDAIKDIPEKTVETANSSSEMKETIPADTADAKGDDTKTGKENAMDNTKPDVKDTVQ